MAIAIPAIVDAQLLQVQNHLRPVQDPATNVSSRPRPPHEPANRIAEIIRMLTDLIDSGTLTETAGGSTSQLTDVGAFTGVNSLVGATFTFDAATGTAALQGVSRVVKSNTTDVLVFTEALPAATAIGDVGTLEFTAVDADLALLDNGKPFGGSNPNVYGAGPSMVNAIVKLIELLGGAVPSYLNWSSAEPFGLGSPHMGGHGQWGHGGADLLADALQVVRDTVAGYTAPA